MAYFDSKREKDLLQDFVTGFGDKYSWMGSSSKNVNKNWIFSWPNGKRVTDDLTVRCDTDRPDLSCHLTMKGNGYLTAWNTASDVYSICRFNIENASFLKTAANTTHNLRELVREIKSLEEETSEDNRLFVSSVNKLGKTIAIDAGVMNREIELSFNRMNENTAFLNQEVEGELQQVDDRTKVMKEDAVHSLETAKTDAANVEKRDWLVAAIKKD